MRERVNETKQERKKECCTQTKLCQLKCHTIWSGSNNKWTDHSSRQIATHRTLSVTNKDEKSILRL